MLKIESLNDSCMGCEACAAVCMNKSITMRMNELGFFYPHIDHNSCTQCKLCEMKCPALNDFSKRENYIQEVYAGWNLEEDIRMESASGGAFSAFAGGILHQKGVVYGAAFCKNFDLMHMPVDNEEQLNGLRGSKYIQSHTADAYRGVKHYLNQGRTVLFSGTPCQVAGLRSYLGNGYERLFAIDLVCHGVLSNGIFRKYINYAEKSTGSKIVNIQFRGKLHGWHIPTFSMKFNNGRQIEQKAKRNFLLSLFYNDLATRPSCHYCRYACQNRMGDITLGDYWGIETVHPELDSPKGVSLIIVNTEKGKQLFSRISDRLEVHKSLYMYAMGGNLPLNKPSSLNIFSRINLKLFSKVKFSKAKVISGFLIFFTKCFRKIRREMIRNGRAI